MRKNLCLFIVCIQFIREIDSLVKNVRPYEKRFAGGGITSREDDLHMCLNHFEIHENKIIRTQDSRALGAKYLNEKDVETKDECLRLCCKTEGCNVFVYDESSTGSCYMFDCGTPDDFKCKFTTHQKYTSAISRQLTELEHQIKFTQHEHELARLREAPQANSTSGIPSTDPPPNKEALAYAFGSPDVHSKKGCSRYQFECHKSGECIAIYNVCDGIPQCSDNSDEAPEGCISKTSSSTPVLQPPLLSPSHPTFKGHEPPSNEGGSKKETSSHDMRSMGPESYSHANEGASPLSNVQSLPQNPPSVQQGPNALKSRANYGREGEGLMNYREEGQWSNQQYVPASQIFTHKGNGLVPQTDERMTQPRPYPVDVPQRQFNEQLPNDYPKYYYENNAYRPYSVQNKQNVNWIPPGRRAEAEAPMNRADYPVNNLPSDYYYEDYRARNQMYNPQGSYPQAQPPQLNPPVVNRVVYSQQQNDLSSNIDETVKHNAPVVAVLASTPPSPHSTTTTASLEDKGYTKVSIVDHVVHSNRKVNKLTAETKFSEGYIGDEIEGHSSSPSGAILSLVMGLSVTTIMVVLVGCRMRVVRKRIRRGGKSGYAHDADFLVNGMYL